MPSTARMPIYLTLVLIGAMTLYLLGNQSVALLDRDEPRYAQASRQMLQSGDWVVPRFLDKIRAKKPPLIYWAQASAMAIFGDNSFAARLPSVLAIVLTATLLAVVLYRSAGPDHAFWTTLVFASSALTIAAAKSCLTDAVLLFWTAVAQLCLYQWWRGRRSWIILLLFSVAVALGLLTKVLIVGTVAATAAMLGIFHLFDRWKRVPLIAPLGAEPTSPITLVVQALVGTTIVLVIVGPWVYLVQRRAPDFLSIMQAEAAGHVLHGMEGHGGPPGTHLLLIWADFLPWSLFIPVAVVCGWQNRREPLPRFALAAALGPWLLVEFTIRTKLPLYMLPTIPALAFLVADGIVRSLRGRRPDLSALPLLTAARGWALALVAISLVPWLAVFRFRSLPWTAMALMPLVTLAWTALAISLLRNFRSAAGMLTIGLGMMLTAGLFYGLYLPRANFLRLSVLAGHKLRSLGATGRDAAIMMDYKEPSLAFYQGGTIVEADDSVVQSGIVSKWKPWMVITRDVWNRTPPRVRGKLTEVAHFRGLSLSDRLRTVEVMIVRPKA